MASSYFRKPLWFFVTNSLRRFSKSAVRVGLSSWRPARCGFWFRFFVFWFRRAPCARGCRVADMRGLGFSLRSRCRVLGFRRYCLIFFLPVGSPRWGHPVESRRTNSGAVIGRSFSNLAAGRPASSSARAVLRSAVLSRPSLSLLQTLEVSALVYSDCI
jgi:hypothetical protein